MRQSLLLLEDVLDLGRRGEVVSVKSGYARNFLLPTKKALLATANALRLQEKLQTERAQQAIVDKKESEELAEKVRQLALQIEVKVDPEGKMYGSVSSVDILLLLEKEGIQLDKRSIVLKKPIKETGVFEVELKLKEGIICSFHLKVIPEGFIALPEEIKSEIAEPTEEKSI